STGIPAALRSILRTLLCEARMSGASASHSAMASSGQMMPTPLTKMRQHGGSGFLDRAARHVDQRPVVPGAEPPRCCDFLGDRLAVDILIVVAMRLAPNEPVFPKLQHPLGSARR